MIGTVVALRNILQGVTSMEIKHYAKPIDSVSGISFDTLMLEIAMGTISTIFAIIGFKVDLIILGLPCAVVAFICWGGIFQAVYYFIKSRSSVKAK